jgi:hypothetical protein
MYQKYTSIHPLHCSFIPYPLFAGPVSTGIIFAFTYMCIHYLHHIHPPTLFPTTSPLPPVPTTPGKNLFQRLVLQFCRRTNIKAKKRNMAFLLVWDKDSYPGSFLILFPCIYVLQPQLVHLFWSSLLLPSPFPMVAPARLGFLYSFLYRKLISHIQVFDLGTFLHSVRSFTSQEKP